MRAQSPPLHDDPMSLSVVEQPAQHFESEAESVGSNDRGDDLLEPVQVHITASLCMVS